LNPSKQKRAAGECMLIYEQGYRYENLRPVNCGCCYSGRVCGKVQ